MCLHKLTSRKWFIQSACATTGEGIYEAMKELSSMVKEYKKGHK
jgi:ADP-ribosylation factor protein 1